MLEEAKLGVNPSQKLTNKEHEKNNLPDVLVCWKNALDTERKIPRYGPELCVAKDEIVANDYDLSPNRYIEVEYEAVKMRAPDTILGELDLLEVEIRRDLENLRAKIV